MCEGIDERMWCMWGPEPAPHIFRAEGFIHDDQVLTGVFIVGNDVTAPAI